MNTIGDRIKELRKRSAMSQTAFADKINVSKQTLYKYENNIITNIPIDKIEAIGKLTNTSPAYLMGWEDNLTTDNANLTVELMTRSDTIEVVRVLLRNDAAFNYQVLQYSLFLETQDRTR